ncbi:MAG: EcsC family protein [Myxococcales bacterium]
MPSFSSLGPRQLKKIASQRFSHLVVAEVGRARARIAELQRTYPSAQPKELAQRLTDSKKAIASTSGAVSGLFGLFAVPLDLVLVAYLQLSLIVDIAVLHKANLKSARAQQELLDVLGYANGAGPLVRASPRVFGRLAMTLLQRGGLPRLGRAVPVVASPLTAWLNNRALARAGREAMLFYGKQNGGKGRGK